MEMRDRELEIGIRNMAEKIDRIEDSLSQVAKGISENNNAIMMTGATITWMNQRIDEVGRALNDQEFAQEIRMGMSRSTQWAVLLTSLSFAIYGIGLSLPDSRMQALGTLGLFPSMLLMVVSFMQSRRHTKDFVRQIQNIGYPGLTKNEKK